MLGRVAPTILLLWQVLERPLVNQMHFRFGLHLGGVLRFAAITHRKTRLGSSPAFPFLDYAATERADNPKITLSASALYQRRYRTLSGTWFPCSRSVIGYQGSLYNFP